MTKTATKARKKATTNKKKKSFGKTDYIRWYEMMLLMRKFEEKCGQLYIQQKFGGFCHLYNGQEAILMGMVEALRKTDRVITAYRDHAHPIAMGVDPKYVMAELYGKATGLSKGKGGSMHMFSVEHNLWGGHGIVGAQIPMGAGLAFADKYRNEDHVTITFFGDGAARQGALHEAFNMAMTWNLPVLYICENNKYAMGTSVERTSNVSDLYKLGLGYDMPSEPVDGMDPEAVHNALEKAAAHIRAGKGPYYLEIKTYRYRGHSVSDPGKYRTKDELNEYKDRDPIKELETKMISEKIASEKEIDAIKNSIADEIAEAVKFAEESDFPLGSELYDDNYVQKDYPFIMD